MAHKIVSQDDIQGFPKDWVMAVRFAKYMHDELLEGHATMEIKFCDLVTLLIGLLALAKK